jgi:hypothetical protein
VGDFFASGMDEPRLRALGVSPLQPELDRRLDEKARVKVW